MEETMETSQEILNPLSTDCISNLKCASPEHVAECHTDSTDSLVPVKTLTCLPSLENIPATVNALYCDQKSPSPFPISSPSPFPISSPSSPCSNSSSVIDHKAKIRRVYTSDSSETGRSPHYSVAHSPISPISSASCSPTHSSLDQEDSPPSPVFELTLTSESPYVPVDEESAAGLQLTVCHEGVSSSTSGYDNLNSPLTETNCDEDDNLNSPFTQTNCDEDDDDYPFSRTPSPFLARVSFESTFLHDDIFFPFGDNINAQPKNCAHVMLGASSKPKVKAENIKDGISSILTSVSKRLSPHNLNDYGNSAKCESVHPANEPSFSGVICDKSIHNSSSYLPSLNFPSPQHTQPDDDKDALDHIGTSFVDNSGKSIRSPVEVIDVDEPCCIDLTSEEVKDSEIEVVANKPPIIYVGSEVTKSFSSKPRSRRNRARKIRGSKLLVPSVRDGNETIVITETPLNLSLGSSESYPIPIVDSPESRALPSNNSEELTNSEIPNFSRLNFIEEQSRLSLDSHRSFGDLLENSVIPIIDAESSSTGSYSLCTCSFGDCVIHPNNLPLKKRILTHSSTSQSGSESRSRSPINTRSTERGNDFSTLHSIIDDLSVPSSSRMGTSITELPADFCEFMRETSNPGSSTGQQRPPIPPNRSISPASRDRSALLASLYQKDLYHFEEMCFDENIKTGLKGRPESSSYRSISPASRDRSALLHTLFQSDLLKYDDVGGEAESSSKSGVPKVASEEDTSPSCPICFETFQCIKEKARLLSSTVCGHIFCTECLEESLKRNKQCPTCRKKLNKKQYHPLYLP